MKKITKTVIAICLTVLIVIGVGDYGYLSDCYHADEIAMEAMAVKTDGVHIEQDGNVVWFAPENLTIGLIFYPGGKVKYTAYAPLLRTCSE